MFIFLSKFIIKIDLTIYQLVRLSLSAESACHLAAFLLLISQTNKALSMRAGLVKIKFKSLSREI